MPKKLPKLEKEWLWPIGIFLLSLLVKLFFIFVVTEPDNPGAGVFVDTYHRWQIAYLTREIGWREGHRLWDLRGFEYLWGVVHPILLNILFSLTGRIDIWLARVLSALAGSGIATLFYLFGRRFFNFWVGLTAGFFISLFPLFVLVDASGYVEPLSLLLLVTAVWFWPKRPFLTGILLALAAMTRIEAWILAMGFLVGLLLFKFPLEKWIISFFGFLLPMIFYMKHLADKTGSVIYPLREYFLGLTQGKWGSGEGFVFTFDLVLMAFLVVAIGGLIWLWRKKPKFTPFFLLGFGGLGMGSFFLSGFKYYLNQLWGLRFIYFPILFGGFLTSVFIFWHLPKTLARGWKKIGSLFFAAWLFLLFTSQILWQSIMPKFNQTAKTWQDIRRVGERFGQGYDGKGKVLIPATTGDLTYSLVKYGGLKGKNIVGQGYDVFYYLGEQTSLDEAAKWLKKEGITWLIPGKNVYWKLIEKEPDWFSFITDLNGYKLYRIHLP